MPKAVPVLRAPTRVVVLAQFHFHFNIGAAVEFGCLTLHSGVFGTWINIWSCLFQVGNQSSRLCREECAPALPGNECIRVGCRGNNKYISTDITDTLQFIKEIRKRF